MRRTRSIRNCKTCKGTGKVTTQRFGPYTVVCPVCRGTDSRGNHPRIKKAGTDSGLGQVDTINKGCT